MYISVAGVPGAAVSEAIVPFDARTAVQVPAEDPDALYRDRENPARAKRATDIWASRLKANPKDLESAWKLAQARYWLGTNGLPGPERRAALESGIEAARTAIDAPFDPDWTPEDRRFKEQAKQLLSKLK